MKVRPLTPLPEDQQALRDWFASQALPWILQSDAWDDYEDVATSAYGIADEMLKKRGEP